MFTTKLWAEVGIWNHGEPALLIMKGIYDDEYENQIDDISVLHDVDLVFPDGYDQQLDDMLGLPWEEPLAALGYRRVSSRHDYTPYSAAFDIKEV
jgi:hypothetical protein